MAWPGIPLRLLARTASAACRPITVMKIVRIRICSAFSFPCSETRHARHPDIRNEKRCVVTGRRSRSPLLTQTLARAFRPVQQPFERAAHQIVVTDNGNE
jgi:hypothetical protein